MLGGVDLFRFWGTKALPVQLQTEAAECGIACLAMISSHWGHHIDLASIRRRFSVSLKGSTLKSLIAIADALGLRSRPLKIEMRHLSDLVTPCILHWDINHFVVLDKVRRSHVVIHDPAIGKRVMSLDEVSNHFTGVALELTPGAGFTRAAEIRRFSLISLMGRVLGLGRGLLQLLLLGISLQIVALAMPFYIQWMVDDALVSADRDLITVLGAGFLLLVVIQTCISAVRSWVATKLAASLNYQWLGNALAHLFKLPLQYFEKRHLGDIVSRFGSIQVIQRNITTQFVEGVLDGFLVLGTLALMLIYSPKLAGVACMAVCAYILIRWSIFKALREATGEQILHAAKQNTHLLESVRGAQSIRLFNRSEERRISWVNILAEQFNAELRISRLSITHQAANSFLFGAERVIVIWLAALSILDGAFSMGMLFAFLSYKEQFSQRIVALIDKLFELRMLRLHGERVADIVMSEPEEPGNDSEIALERISPSIEIAGLACRYSDGDPYVLRNLDLVIPAGQCIAITGASGCGKTTLLKVLLGLVEPSEGEILVGGVAIKKLGLTNYRKLIGTVMQDDHLFAGSIADNICFFDPSPDQERIEYCSSLARVDREIESMPMGYHTLIGDIGTGLSGGQKQRILLARALYAKPKILVLDEATSHLDTANERLVNNAVRALQLTRVLVAHRPETIVMAERVVVIENGRIKEQ